MNISESDKTMKEKSPIEGGRTRDPLVCTLRDSIRTLNWKP